MTNFHRQYYGTSSVRSVNWDREVRGHRKFLSLGRAMPFRPALAGPEGLEPHSRLHASHGVAIAGRE